MTTKSKPTLSDVDVITPPVRLAFPSLFKKRPKFAEDPNSLHTYQAVALIPPEVDMAPFVKAIRAAMAAKWGDKVKTLPADKNPIKNCADKADTSGYENGWRFINLHTGYQPQVVDRNRQLIIEESAIYPGCWVRFHIKAYAWEKKSVKGVSFSLEAVQFVRDDDRLDGRRKAEDIFDPLDGDAGGDTGEVDDLFS